MRPSVQIPRAHRKVINARPAWKSICPPNTWEGRQRTDEFWVQRVTASLNKARSNGERHPVSAFDFHTHKCMYVYPQAYTHTHLHTSHAHAKNKTFENCLIMCGLPATCSLTWNHPGGRRGFRAHTFGVTPSNHCSVSWGRHLKGACRLPVGVNTSILSGHSQVVLCSPRDCLPG